MKACGRYLEGERNRQAIIDILLRHPEGYCAPQIIAELRPAGLDEDAAKQFYISISGRLGKLVDAGEVRREKELYPTVTCDGKNVKVATYRYWTNVEKTRSVADVCAELGRNFSKLNKMTREEKAEAKARERELAEARKAVPPWVTRNVDPDRMAIPRQGGQGASRPRQATYLEVML